MVDIDAYDIEKECEYKGERYLVRDNGAIMRLPKEGRKPRALDNNWTFGYKSEKNGYMFFSSSVRVHQVVATAFHGAPISKEMIVDHKDTNRCNNRPENLHWVTRLENVLNNPITRQKIEYLCGSIEAFLEDPSILRDTSLDQNFSWMRTVSKEEAAYCKANLERWAAEDKPRKNASAHTGFTESIFQPRPNAPKGNMTWEELRRALKPESEDRKPLADYTQPVSNGLVADHAEEEPKEEEHDYSDSLTPSALQENWKTPTEFPLCPSTVTDLMAYKNNLEEGKVFSKNNFGEYKVVDSAMYEDDTKLLVCSESDEGIKPYSLAFIYINENHYVHANVQTYFHKDGMLKYFTLMQGKEWTGGDVFDDYC